MELHHSKHHATYVKGFNAAAQELEQAEQAQDVKKIITLEKAINFNGGGKGFYSPPILKMRLLM